MQARQQEGRKPAEAEVRKCADTLRGDGVTAAASPYERMESLVRLDAVAGGGLLSRLEALEWAKILAAAGHPDAVAAFDRVLSMPGEPLGPELLVGFAAVLWRQGQWTRAADVCDRVLPGLPPDDESYAGLLQLRAASLVKAWGQQEKNRDAALRKRLLEAMRPVCESNLPVPVRREALVQWVAIGGDLAAAEVLPVLAARDELVQGSAYLLYCRAAAAGPLIRNLTGKSVGIAGGGGLGSRGDLLYGTGAGFNEAIGALRGKGLDLVLVLDATDSMTPYIKQAKQRLGEVLNVVTTLVPTVRIGIVAYKDYGDDYGPTACKGLRLTSDANAVRAFLNDIVAGGGGDEPEPINEALKVATDAKAMGWNMARKRVIVLVGDSTCHPSGRQEAFRLAKAFADRKGTVNVIDPGGSGEQTARRAQVQPDLKRIAKDGGGEAFLLVEETEFWQHLIVSVFGQRFKADVDMIIQRVAKKE